MDKFRFPLVGFIALVLLIMAPLPVFADTTLSQMGGNSVVVPEGQIIENVLAVSSDARIFGAVNDIILVINGNTYLEPNSQVDLVIDLGGSVYNSSQRPAKTGIFEFSFTLQLINNFLLGGAMVAGFWFLRLMGSLLGIIVLSCLGFLLRKYLSPYIGQSKELLKVSVARLFGIGTVGSLIVFASIILFSLTVIGIPLAIIILMGYLSAVIVGLIPVMDHLGRKWLSPQITNLPILTNLLIKAILFVAISNLPLFGYVFMAGSGILGLGLVLTIFWTRLRLGKRKVDKKVI